MKTKLLSEEPLFYGKDFREDLDTVEKTPDKIVEALAGWLDVSSRRDYSDNDKWIPLSRQTGLPIDDLLGLFRPILWISSRCIKENVSLDDLVDDLSEAARLGTGDSEIKLRERLLRLGRPTIKALRGEQAIPSLPLRYVASIKTKCILVSAFEQEHIGRWRTADLSNYSPTLRSLYPCITLELSFKGEEKESIGILLRPVDLRMFREALQMAEVELKAVASMSADARIVVEEG